MTSDFQWQFGGLLQPLPPPLAWSILALIAIAGLLAIILLYRRTLRHIPPASRNALTALRVLLLLALCLLLTNPSHVRLPNNTQPTQRHLAVLVDRSASMDAIDNRNQTRLQNALQLWKTHLDEASKAFDQIDNYRFATRLEKVPTLDDAIKPATPGSETRLWAAIHAAMAGSPAGVVCLTDGLDTSGADAGAIIGEAQSRGIPLYFVPARNRSRPANLLCVRDIKTPSQVLRLSKFQPAALLEISTPKDSDVPVELWSGSRKLAAATLKARAGWNVLPWSPEISAGEPGPMPLEFRLGEGAGQQTAASTTQVVESTSIEILYYQGALQWGYRFLRGALESDSSFKLTSILNPALGVKISSGAANALDDIPDNAADLKRFKIVILAHVLADQLSPKQQQALVDYARAGGGVLFIAPDSAATNRFAGTPIEAMLPVVFEPRPEQTDEQYEAEAFEARMRSAFSSDGEDALLSDGASGAKSPQLLPFQVLPGATGILKGGDPPMFSNYARVLRAKPAAEILAVHPTDRTADDAPRILLARQQFGSGFTVAMATDLLWRWKMSLPSASHAAETFWQQLMLSLVPAPPEGLRIIKSSSTAALNRLATLLVIGAPGDIPPAIQAISPAGSHQSLTATSSDAGWKSSFTPTLQGRWQLTATDSAGNLATMSLPVQQQVQTAENSNTPPDIDGMRRIADSTGGALVDTDPVFQPQAAPPPLPAAEKSSQPIWDNNWLIGALLGIYALELIARRMFRLL